MYIAPHSRLHFPGGYIPRARLTSDPERHNGSTTSPPSHPGVPRHHEGALYSVHPCVAGPHLTGSPLLPPPPHCCGVGAAPRPSGTLEVGWPPGVTSRAAGWCSVVVVMALEVVLGSLSHATCYGKAHRHSKRTHRGRPWLVGVRAAHVSPSPFELDLRAIAAP
ncbi:hypothetical protein BDY21DRAFT_113016 [Lineolata rhizophorae]|uniref:Uncharacterized protein n=1 Tax=Lineolata rhizophorae TaxID=578093 RepID=A0A6A6NS70_9PEZI|nr:hypothetical protein BDY21DRAFT_113016 [Lineolata rhizophorae]